jgi:hypothetical protein
MLGLSFCHGASRVAGVELKNEGQADIFAVALTILHGYGIDASCANAKWGVNVLLECAQLPTAQVEGEHFPKVVYFFSDGWNPTDRKQVYKLVGEDPLVSIFICSLGRGGGDPYRYPDQVLEALNCNGWGHFVASSAMQVPMLASKEKKDLIFFKRR